jgi:hypothetical protein
MKDMQNKGFRPPDGGIFRHYKKGGALIIQDNNVSKGNLPAE